MRPGLWLPRIDFSPSVQLRLVCFAHAGGSPASFVRWSMPEGVALCPVCLPGRGRAMQEPPLRSIEAIVDGAFGALSTLPPRPTVLFGHSFGAAVAFEVARRMEAVGRSPELLVVSGKPPAHLPSSVALMAHLPDPEFVDALQQTYGGIPREVRDEPELLAMMLPSMRADLHASESYQPSPDPQLSCPILVTYGTGDRALVPEQMVRWQDLTRGAVTIEPYPGEHFYLFDGPSFEDGLSRRLQRLLREKV